MVAFRWWILAPLLIVVGAGCTARPAAEDRAPSSAAVSSTTPTRVSTSPAAAVVSSSAARPARSRSTPSPIRQLPPVSAKARAAGLVDIRTIIPDAIIDLRYATSNNFVGVRLYPTDARCLVHESMAAGLTTAANQLRRAGDLLVFWDCYRPHAVQVRMFEIVPDPNWVARPGPYATSHEAARSVDVTLAKLATSVQCAAAQRIQGHCLLDMGTDFDDFSAHAHAFASYGISSQAQSNRSLLRSAMNSGGIVVYSGEWWHFDGPGSTVQRAQLDAPVD